MSSSRSGRLVSLTSWRRGIPFRRPSADNRDLVCTGLAHPASYFFASFGLIQKELTAFWRLTPLGPMLFHNVFFNAVSQCFFPKSRVEVLYFPLMQNSDVLGCFRLFSDKCLIYSSLHDSDVAWCRRRENTRNPPYFQNVSVLVKFQVDQESIPR